MNTLSETDKMQQIKNENLQKKKDELQEKKDELKERKNELEKRKNNKTQMLIIINKKLPELRSELGELNKLF